MNKSTKNYNFLSSIIKFSVSSWVNFIIGIASTVIITRIFSPEIYGNINIFNVTSSTIMSILCLGLDSSYIRFYNQPPNKNSSIQLVFKLIAVSLLISVVIGSLTLLFLYKQFTSVVFGQVNWFLTIMVFTSAIANLTLRFLNITYRMSFNARKYTIQNILVQATTKLFVIVAALFNPTAIFVITLQVIGIIILLLIYLFKQWNDIIPSKIDFNFKGYSEVFKYAFFSAPIYVVIQLNAFLSQMILRIVMDVGAVGIYASTNAFVAILKVLKGGFGTYWSAYMFANYEKDQDNIIRVHDYMMLYILFAFLGIVAFKDVIYLLIGAQYQASKEFFSLVLVYPVLSIAAETTMYGLSIEKKNHITLVIYTVSVISNLVISLILTNYMGIKGAALASAISGVIMFTLDTYWGQKFYRSVKSIKKMTIGVMLILLVSITPILITEIKIVNLSLITLIILINLNYKSEIKGTISIIRDIINTQK